MASPLAPGSVTSGPDLEASSPSGTPDRPSPTANEIAALSDAIGLRLDLFRPEHLAARLGSLLTRWGVETIDDLEALARRDPVVRAGVRRAIAISVTGFFRDPEQFALLAAHIGRDRPAGHFRAWSAGCATGHELWSVAVLLEGRGLLDGAQLLGSDLLAENVRSARLGMPRADHAGRRLPAVHPRFEVRDLVQDGAPGRRWDLVLCRNVAIYLAPGARARLHETLCGAVRAGGLLLLGRSERLAGARALGMQAIGPHLYRKVGLT